MKNVWATDWFYVAVLAIWGYQVVMTEVSVDTSLILFGLCLLGVRLEALLRKGES